MKKKYTIELTPEEINAITVALSLTEAHFRKKSDEDASVKPLAKTLWDLSMRFCALESQFFAE